MGATMVGCSPKKKEREFPFCGRHDAARDEMEKAKFKEKQIKYDRQRRSNGAMLQESLTRKYHKNQPNQPSQENQDKQQKRHIRHSRNKQMIYNVEMVQPPQNEEYEPFSEIFIMKKPDLPITSDEIEPQSMSNGDITDGVSYGTYTADHDDILNLSYSNTESYLNTESYMKRDTFESELKICYIGTIDEDEESKKYIIRITSSSLHEYELTKQGLPISVDSLYDADHEDSVSP